MLAAVDYLKWVCDGLSKKLKVRQQPAVLYASCKQNWGIDPSLRLQNPEKSSGM